MKKYLIAFKMGVSREMAYRFDFVMDFVIGLLGILISIFVWKFVYAGRESIAGFTFQSLITYYFLILLLSSLNSGPLVNAIGDFVRRGRLSTFLIKPQNTPIFILVVQSGIGAFIFSIYLALGMLAAFLSHGVILFQTGILPWVLFLAGCMMLFFTNMLIYFFVGCLSFWLTRLGGLTWLVRESLAFLSGAYFPLVFFPQTVQNILKFTPFYYMRNFVSLSYLGEISPLEFLRGAEVLMLWIVILCILCTLIWKQGLKQFESVNI